MVAKAIHCATVEAAESEHRVSKVSKQVLKGGEVASQETSRLPVLTAGWSPPSYFCVHFA